MKNRYKEPLERIAKSGTHVKTDDLIYIVEQFIALEQLKIDNLKLEISSQLRGIIREMSSLNQTKAMRQNIEALQSVDNYLENTDEY
jgi:hypothetical protein